MKIAIAFLASTSQAQLSALSAWDTYTAYDATYDATITAATATVATYSSATTDGLVCSMQLVGGVLTDNYDYGMLTTVSCALTPKQTSTANLLCGWCLNNPIPVAESDLGYTGQSNCFEAYYTSTDTSTVSTATNWSVGSITSNEADNYGQSTDLTAVIGSSEWYFEAASVASSVVTIPVFQPTGSTTSATLWVYQVGSASTITGICSTSDASAVTPVAATDTLDLSSVTAVDFSWVGAKKLIAVGLVATYALAL